MAVALALLLILVAAASSRATVLHPHAPNVSAAVVHTVQPAHLHRLR